MDFAPQVLVISHHTFLDAYLSVNLPLDKVDTMIQSAYSDVSSIECSYDCIVVFDIDFCDFPRVSSWKTVPPLISYSTTSPKQNLCFRLEYSHAFLCT